MQDELNKIIREFPEDWHLFSFVYNVKFNITLGGWGWGDGGAGVHEAVKSWSKVKHCCWWFFFFFFFFSCTKITKMLLEVFKGDSRESSKLSKWFECPYKANRTVNVWFSS